MSRLIICVCISSQTYTTLTCFQPCELARKKETLRSNAFKVTKIKNISKKDKHTLYSRLFSESQRATLKVLALKSGHQA